DVRTAFMRHLCHPRAQIDPELRVGLSEADHRRPRHQARQPKRGEHRFIEARGALEIGDADGNVIDHGWLISGCGVKAHVGLFEPQRPMPAVTNALSLARFRGIDRLLGRKRAGDGALSSRPEAHYFWSCDELFGWPEGGLLCWPEAGL